MSQINSQTRARTPCAQCPLVELPQFCSHDDSELAFIAHFKAGEFSVDAQTTILAEGAHSAHLYTMLNGWAFRYKMLEDGRRQILNYAVPGDLIGLQGALMQEMQHSIEAMTPVTLCVFQRDRLRELYEKHPDLAFDITWLAAREERLLDEHLLSVGRRTAHERAAYLLAFLGTRAVMSTPACGVPDRPNDRNGADRQPHVDIGGTVTLPITQRHVADTLGLSLVHTNKTMRRLADKGLVEWRDGGCVVKHIEKLADIAGWVPDTETRRRFI